MSGSKVFNYVDYYMIVHKRNGDIEIDIFNNNNQWVDFFYAIWSIDQKRLDNIRSNLNNNINFKELLSGDSNSYNPTKININNDYGELEIELMFDYGGIFIYPMSKKCALSVLDQIEKLIDKSEN